MSRGGFPKHTRTCKCVKILFIEWLVYMEIFWYTRVFVRPYHGFNHDTMKSDLVQLFRVLGSILIIILIKYE